jgi:hypothetical protein
VDGCYLLRSAKRHPKISRLAIAELA